MTSEMSFVNVTNSLIRRISQLTELRSLPSSHASIPLLREVIQELRDDELEHLDTAIIHHAQRAPAHALLSTVIGVGCKVAIEVCKRI